MRRGKGRGKRRGRKENTWTKTRRKKRITKRRRRMDGPESIGATEGDKKRGKESAEPREGRRIRRRRRP